MTHTPGPWIVDAAPEFIRPTDICKEFPDGTLGLVCELTYSVFREQQGANARLIAAAPELLEVLVALTEWGCTYTSPHDTNSPHELLIAARAAIAKATGAADDTESAADAEVGITDKERHAADRYADRRERE